MDNMILLINAGLIIVLLFQNSQIKSLEKQRSRAALLFGDIIARLPSRTRYELQHDLGWQLPQSKTNV